MLLRKTPMLEASPCVCEELCLGLGLFHDGAVGGTWKNTLQIFVHYFKDLCRMQRL